MTHSHEPEPKSGTTPATAGRPSLRQVAAATLEYLSLLPSPQLLFDLLPLDRWFPPGEARGIAGRLVERLRHARAVTLPLPLRRFFARLNPDYDPELTAWPRSAWEYSLLEKGRLREAERARLHSLLSRHRWLDAYEYAWSIRRPATRRRLTLPLYRFFGGAERPVLATVGTFAWSGFLHALWFPLLFLYGYLALHDGRLALLVFGGWWLAYTALGLPIAYKKWRRHRQRASHHRPWRPSRSSFPP